MCYLQASRFRKLLETENEVLWIITWTNITLYFENISVYGRTDNWLTTSCYHYSDLASARKLNPFVQSPVLAPLSNYDILHYSLYFFMN